MLIVNDDDMQLYCLRSLFKLVKFDISLARNGFQAVEMTKARLQQIVNPDFDLIVLDINMPIMNGMDACRSILKLYNEFGVFSVPKAASSRNLNGDMEKEKSIIPKERWPVIIAVTSEAVGPEE